MRDLNFEGRVFILGNQAADLDSSVSAFSLAALLEALNPGLTTLPLIQGEIDDLRLKPEIPALFNRARIEIKNRNFLNGESPLPSDPQIILVDHNKPDIPGLEHSVKAVIDHHRDEGFFKDLPLRIIRKTGSCATLVAELWEQSGLEIPRVQRLILLAAVAVDTGCLNPEWGKTTQEDKEIYQFLSYRLGNDDLSFIRSLSDIKQDLSHLNQRDQLRRDFKDFSPGQFRAGISSVPMTVNEFFSPDFFNPAECGEFMERNCPDLLIVMHSAAEPFQRQLSFYASRKGLKGQSSPAALMMKTLESLGGFTARPSPAAGWQSFNQQDPKRSRKVLAPLLKDRFEQLMSGNSAGTKTNKRGKP